MLFDDIALISKDENKIVATVSKADFHDKSRNRLAIGFEIEIIEFVCGKNQNINFQIYDNVITRHWDANDTEQEG